MESADRSAQAASTRARDTATTAEGAYGAQAGSIYGDLVPTANRWLTTPPGMSAQDLAMMGGAAGSKAAGVTGALQENARLRAMRSRNLAGLGGQQDAIAQAAARAQGQDIQDILGANAKLKEQQRQEAMRTLGGLYGESVRGQLGEGANVSRDIANQIEAGKSGWFQNMLGLMNTAEQPFRVTYGLGGPGGSSGGSTG